MVSPPSASGRTLKRLIPVAITLLLVTTLASCARSRPEPADDRIQPGDRIGDLLITTGDDGDMVFIAKIRCPVNPSTKTEICEIPVGTVVNAGLGADVVNYSGENLVSRWLRQSYEMTINGRPVNLLAFGSIATTHPIRGEMRLWNVVIVSEKPGVVSVRHSGEIGGVPVDGVTVLVFTGAAESPGPIARAWAEVPLPDMDRHDGRDQRARIW